MRVRTLGYYRRGFQNIAPNRSEYQLKPRRYRDPILPRIQAYCSPVLLRYLPLRLAAGTSGMGVDSIRPSVSSAQ